MDEKDLTKKVLIEVAKDLSKIFEQPIKIGGKTTNDEIKKDLISAGNELQKDDTITDKSKEVLTLLGVELPFEEGEEKGEEKLGKKGKKGKKGEKAAGKKATNEKKYNRAQAFCDALSGKAKTITEIAQKAMDLHSAAHPSKNQPQLSSIEWAVKDYLQPLIILGFVEKKENKYSLAK